MQDLYLSCKNQAEEADGWKRNSLKYQQFLKIAVKISMGTQTNIV